MIDFVQARRNMIDSQLRPCDVNDPLLLQAIFDIPRQSYLAPGREAFAYIDQNVLVSPDSERRMLQPMVLARMIQALEINPGERVLDVACGYGYSSAVMAQLGAHVIAIEEDPALANAARERITAGSDITVISGDLSEGAPQHEPFDAILVNGAIEIVPENLLGQLKEMGRLIAVFTDGKVSRAILYTRSGNAFGKREIIDASVPLLKSFRAEPAFAF